MTEPLDPGSEGSVLYPPELADLECLIEIWLTLVTSQQAYGTTLLGDPNRKHIRRFLARLLVEDGIRCVAINGEIVGFVTYECQQDRFKRSVERGFIHNLFVKEPYRGLGLGTKLLEAAEAELIERGVDVVRLEAMATNEKAHEFYRNRGFRPHRVVFQKTVETDTSNSSGR